MILSLRSPNYEGLDMYFYCYLNSPKFQFCSSDSSTQFCSSDSSTQLCSKELWLCVDCGSACVLVIAAVRNGTEWKII
jgi:hypothetical protein